MEDFGVTVFKDTISKKLIWREFIGHKETLADYRFGFKCCLEQDYFIKAVVSMLLKN